MSYANDMLQYYYRLFPNFQDQYRDFVKARGRGDLSWPDWCYCPMAGAVAIVSQTYQEQGATLGEVCRIDSVMLPTLAALAAWRPGKGIYKFDRDLARSLTQLRLGDSDIPSEVLLRMPEWCVWVEATEQTDPFFAFLEYDPNNEDVELRINVYPRTGGTPPIGFPLAVHLRSGSLFDATQVLNNQNMLTGGDCMSPQSQRAYAASLEPYVQLCLYLCSDEPDLSSPQQPRGEQQPRRTHVAQHERVWNVGDRLGAQLRAWQPNPSQEPQGGSHGSPRPHLRRAHWHTYLTDHGRRTPRLKWVHPCLVNSASGESSPTIHEVRP